MLVAYKQNKTWNGKEPFIKVFHIVTVHRKCLVSRDDTRQFDLCWAAFAILPMFFFVHLTLEYDYMCSETDFTQENKRIGLGGKVVLL